MLDTHMSTNPPFYPRSHSLPGMIALCKDHEWTIYPVASVSIPCPLLGAVVFSHEMVTSERVAVKSWFIQSIFTQL